LRLNAHLAKFISIHKMSQYSLGSYQQYPSQPQPQPRTQQQYSHPQPQPQAQQYSQPQPQLQQSQYMQPQPQYQEQGQGQGPEQKLQTKVMVVYILPNDRLSALAYQQATNYPEIHIEDARTIQPRPNWMTQFPCAVLVKTKQVFFLENVLKLIQAYVAQQQIMTGAASDMVVATSGRNDAFPVADKNVHHMAAAEERRIASIPVGTGNHQAMSAGQVQINNDNDSRYTQTGKGISEGDLAQYNQLRSTRRTPPMQWRQSALGTSGDPVNW